MRTEDEESLEHLIEALLKQPAIRLLITRNNMVTNQQYTVEYVDRNDPRLAAFGHGPTLVDAVQGCIGRLTEKLRDKPC